jgi:hypothetical protein
MKEAVEDAYGNGDPISGKGGEIIGGDVPIGQDSPFRPKVKAPRKRGR